MLTLSGKGGKGCLRMLRVSGETAKLLLIVWQLCADTLSLLYHLPSAFSKAQEESGYVIAVTADQRGR